MKQTRSALIFDCAVCGRLFTIVGQNGRRHRRVFNRWEKRIRAAGWRIRTVRWWLGRRTLYFCPPCFARPDAVSRRCDQFRNAHPVPRRSDK